MLSNIEDIKQKAKKKKWKVRLTFLFLIWQTSPLDRVDSYASW